MTRQGQQVLDAALRLPPAERERVVEYLLASFTTPAEQRAIDAAWATEAESRIAAYERGELSAVSADAAFARIHARLAALQ